MEAPKVTGASAGPIQAADIQGIKPQNRPAPGPVKDSIVKAPNPTLLEATTSLLSTIASAQSLLSRAQSWGLIILSSTEQAHLKDCGKAIGFFLGLTGFIDKLATGSALKTPCIAFSKLAIAGLSIYANFFKDKSLKEIIRPLSALVGLVTEKSALDKQSKEIRSHGLSMMGLCKLCKTLSSVATKMISVAAFASGGAISLPLLIYALGLMQTGCGVVIEGHDYINDYIAGFSLVGM